MTPVFRQHLSMYHLKAAQHAARDAQGATEELASSGSMPPTYLTMSSVICAVAFLEANINELLHNAMDPFGQVMVTISDTERTTIARLAPLIERRGVLDKHQAVLGFTKGRELDRSSSTWDDARTLVDLRNYLVHYKPQDIRISRKDPDQSGEMVVMQKKLNGKFSIPERFRLEPSGFPTSYLQPPCARWAVDAAVDFARSFYQSLDPDSHLVKTLENERGV